MLKLIAMWRTEEITDNLSNFGDILFHHEYILSSQENMLKLRITNYCIVVELIDIKQGNISFTPHNILSQMTWKEKWSYINYFVCEYNGFSNRFEVI